MATGASSPRNGELCSGCVAIHGAFKSLVTGLNGLSVWSHRYLEAKVVMVIPGGIHFLNIDDPPCFMSRPNSWLKWYYQVALAVPVITTLQFNRYCYRTAWCFSLTVLLIKQVEYGTGQGELSRCQWYGIRSAKDKTSSTSTHPWRPHSLIPLRKQGPYLIVKLLAYSGKIQ